MAKASAGILMYRCAPTGPEFLLVHSGTPFWRKKDLGAWSIPKGNLLGNEEYITAAKREFTEETGIVIPEQADLIKLNPIKQKSGKTVHVWACKSQNNESFIGSIEFEMEWPPRSGKKTKFPEIDRGEFFSLTKARTKIIAEQFPLITELISML